MSHGEESEESKNTEQSPFENQLRIQTGKRRERPLVMFYTGRAPQSSSAPLEQKSNKTNTDGSLVCEMQPAAALQGNGRGLYHFI